MAPPLNVLPDNKRAAVKNNEAEVRDFDQMSEQRSINFDAMSNKDEFSSVTELFNQQ